LQGLDRIRDEFEVPGPHPPEVLAAAERAVRRAPTEHRDRTATGFVTLDPATSTDLDQAFAIEPSGSELLLHYAIADVGWFVEHGDPVDREAWRRGVTVYLPDGRASLHPPVLAEDAASLLPGVDRPAVVYTVRVDPAGAVSLEGAERAVVRSRAKLAYDAVRPEDLPAGFEELTRRLLAAEAARGAGRVDLPEQELESLGATPADGVELRLRARLGSEVDNAALSLACNMAAADVLVAAGTGLFRVLPAPDERQVRWLRFTAEAFGLDWRADEPLDAFERRLPLGDPAATAFSLAVRRAAGGASYAPYQPGARPWHSAVAATYAHVSAPLRRLQDRYVADAVLAVVAGAPVPETTEAAFLELPEVMAEADRRANGAAAAALDLAEALALRGREGERFAAVVVDADDRGARLQLVAPPVVTRVRDEGLRPGDRVEVELRAADVPRRRVEVAVVAVNPPG
jgi:exoribonuclease R